MCQVNYFKLLGMQEGRSIYPRRRMGLAREEGDNFRSSEDNKRPTSIDF